MGQVYCAQCVEVEEAEKFDPSQYVDLPGVTREDVLQLKVAFDYLSPRNGLVNIHRARLKDPNSPFLQTLLCQAAQDSPYLTFDDLYRLTKGKISDWKRRETQVEGGSMNSGCLFCPYASREPTPRGPDRKTCS